MSAPNSNNQHGVPILGLAPINVTYYGGCVNTAAPSYRTAAEAFAAGNDHAQRWAGGSHCVQCLGVVGSGDGFFHYVLNLIA